MFKDIGKIIQVIKKFYFKNLISLQFIIFTQSTFQILSILSIGPLLSLMVNPNFDPNKKFLINTLNMEFSFVELLIISIFLFIIANLLNLIVIRKSLYLSNLIGRNISNNLYFLYLNKEYIFFFDKKLSNFIALMTTEVQRVVQSIILPILILSSKILTIIFIIIGFSIYSPLVSISGVLISIILSSVFYFLIKKKLYDHGKNISNQSFIRNGLIVEAFGNIKQTKLFKAYNFFYKKFNLANTKLINSFISSRFIENLIKNVIEIIVFCLLLLMLYFILLFEYSIVNYIPLFAVLLYAAYKVIPAIQNVVSILATIRSNIPSLENVTREFGINIMSTRQNLINFKKSAIKVNELSLRNINFSYNKSRYEIFKNANIKFKRGKFIGIYGPSGSGKSTLADLFTGLLKPNKGKVLINKKLFEFKENLDLRNLISYTSQNFSILNDTFDNNVIFSNELNRDKLNKAIYLSEAVKIKKKNKNKKLGDMGSKLSGGQKQRLALARTFYNNSQVIILDEPTSALDSTTELNIVKRLREISKNKIIIFFTHNENLKRYFNEVYIIKNQKIKKI